MSLAIKSILYLNRLSTKFQTLKLMIYEISNELFAIFLSQHCIFAITQWFSYQYIIYYIPLESCHFPLSNVIINVSKFPHIQSLYPLQAHIFLFNLSYLFPIQILTSKMPLAIESILCLNRLSTKF